MTDDNARTEHRTEHQEQAMLMYLIALDHPEIDEHLFAIPNGGLRHPKVARALKSEGVKPGVPDLFLAVTRGDCPGLFIEMKRRKGGRVSKEQRAWHDRLRAQGYSVGICRGYEEALHEIVVYFRDEGTKRTQ